MGDHYACEHFAKHGWCAYAHGEHEIGGGVSTPVVQPSAPLIAWRAPQIEQKQWSLQAEHEGSAKLNRNRRKTRLCQQFVDSGGDHSACSHFARHGWCAYAHGEHE